MLERDRDYKIDPDKPYKITKVAELLGVGRDTVYRELDDGKMEYHNIRKNKIVYGREIIAYLEKCKVIK